MSSQARWRREWTSFRIYLSFTRSNHRRKLQVKTSQAPSSSSVWKRHWPEVQEIILISYPLLNFFCSTNAEDLSNSLHLGIAKSLCPGYQPASPFLSVPLNILFIPPPLLLPSRLTCKCFMSQRRTSKDGTGHLFVYFHKTFWELISEAFSLDPDGVKNGEWVGNLLYFTCC